MLLLFSGFHENETSFGIYLYKKDHGSLMRGDNFSTFYDEREGEE